MPGPPSPLVSGNTRQKIRLSFLALQDVDSAFMNKVDLQSRVDSLFGEVNFLKQLFEIVSSILIRNPCLFSSYMGNRL